MNPLICLLLFAAGTAVAGTDAQYTVPIQDPALSPYAEFKIEEAKLRIRKGFAKMEYDLPQALGGELPIKVEVQGVVRDESKPFHLTGEFGEMDCEIKGAIADCHIKYERERFTPLSDEGKQAVETFLATTISDPIEREARTQVFQAFSHEAAGDCRNVPIRRK